MKQFDTIEYWAVYGQTNILTLIEHIEAFKKPTKMNLTKVTAKELAIKMNICEHSAKNLLKDVKEHYGIKLVTISHISHYLKIPNPVNM